LNLVDLRPSGGAEHNCVHRRRPFTYDGRLRDNKLLFN